MIDTEIRGIAKYAEGIGSPASGIKIVRSCDENEFNRDLLQSFKEGFKIIQPIEHVAVGDRLFHVAVVSRGALPK